MASIYGPHIINNAGPHLADLARLQPKAALFLDPNPDDVAHFRTVCPNTICIGRIYVPDSEVEGRIVSNPEEAALWAHGLVLGHPARSWIHYWQITNEVCQFADKLPLINRFFVRWMQLADMSNYKCAIFGWSVGQLDLPAHDRLALWRMVYPTCDYAEKHSHIGLLHQYGAPDLWGPPEKGGAPWLVNRLETQVLPILPYKNLKFVVGEYGIDGLLLMGLGRSLAAEVEDPGVGVHTPPKPMVGPEMVTAYLTRGITGPTGWQAFTDAPGYVKQLTDMGQWLGQFSNRILGYCIFTLGSNSPWQSYDIRGDMLRGLADYYSQDQPPVVPPVVPPEVPMAHPIEVIDGDGSVHDLAWLQANYGTGIRVLFAEPPSFQLQQIMIDVSDNVSMNIWVQKENGQPQAGQPCTYSYPAVGQTDPTVQSSPDLPEIPLVVKSRWCQTGVQNKNLTDGSGLVSFQIGSSSWISNGRGPYCAWVMSPSVPSDALDGIGWKGLTNHHGPTQMVFRYVPAAVVVPPVDPGGALPEQEPVMTVGTLADKCRWWLEESVRQDEAGNTARAKAIRYSLIKLQGGLFYRLENALRNGKLTG